MMKVAIQTYFGQEREKIAKEARKAGFVLDGGKPDFVIIYGGDGTVLSSEAAFPGVPKLVFRKSIPGTHYPSCRLAELDKVLESLSKGQCSIREYAKALAEVKGKKLSGLNEVQIHNADPRKAIRFDVSLDGKPLYKNVIGDGIVAATPFGSHAYYMAVGCKPFETGLRAAFNNTKPRPNPVELDKDDILAIEIKREKALVLADNQKDFVNLASGDRVEIRQAKDVARFVLFRG
ncbi:MAG: NAD(+)/NADH kinase [Candidatus Aenigmarchaeota archaeon]|nr:NAD(+)/NADH kinase [Candidatus Aenigmarchaeota archaeon]